MTSVALPFRGLPVLCALLLFTAACSRPVPEPTTLSSIDPDRLGTAIRLAEDLRADGGRVWCVPFARNASGIDIRGNANTWWEQAKGSFDRLHQPRVGSVLSFRSTRSMPMGHVAVVSEVVSPREIKVDHANWHRNQVSLNMAVIDVSDKNDWSSVRVESAPNSFGSVYPVNGFISTKGF